MYAGPQELKLLIYKDTINTMKKESNWQRKLFADHMSNKRLDLNYVTKSWGYSKNNESTRWVNDLRRQLNKKTQSHATSWSTVDRVHSGAPSQRWTEYTMVLPVNSGQNTQWRCQKTVKNCNLLSFCHPLALLLLRGHNEVHFVWRCWCKLCWQSQGARHLQHMLSLGGGRMISWTWPHGDSN